MRFLSHEYIVLTPVNTVAPASYGLFILSDMNSDADPVRISVLKMVTVGIGVPDPEWNLWEQSLYITM